MNTWGRMQEWCVCGYSVFGTMSERRNALAAHRKSDLHKHLMKKKGKGSE